MNTQNLDYLKENLKFMGFGTSLHTELEKSMQSQQPEFQLKATASYHQSAVDYTLHFWKSEATGLYFFNKYDALYKHADSKQDKSQTFYLHKGSGITAKEAYNLLEGRAVYKELLNTEGQPYKAWLQLDMASKSPSGNHKLKQYHENYGYDLEKTLQRFYIKELQDPQQKEQLLYSLRKGNLHTVTALEEGYEVKRMIEASPQFKTINVYNEQRHHVMRETIQKQPVNLLRQQVPSHNLKPENSLQLRTARHKGLTP